MSISSTPGKGARGLLTALSDQPPIENVNLALAALLATRNQYRNQPALSYELGRLIGHAGNVRRMLLSGAETPKTTVEPHGVALVAEAKGVSAHCLCHWRSASFPSTAKGSGGWAKAQAAGAEHLAGAGGQVGGGV